MKLLQRLLAALGDEGFAMRVLRTASYAVTYGIVLAALISIPIVLLTQGLIWGILWTAGLAIFGRFVWSPYIYVDAAEIAAIKLFGKVGHTKKPGGLLIVPFGSKPIRIPSTTEEIKEPIDDVKSSDGFHVKLQPNAEVRSGDVATLIKHLGEDLSYEEMKQTIHHLAFDELAEISRDIANELSADELHRMKANDFAKLVEEKLDEPNPQWNGECFAEHFGFDEENTVSFEVLVVPDYAESLSQREKGRLKGVADRDQAMVNAGMDPDDPAQVKAWRDMPVEEKIRLTNMSEDRTSEEVHKHVYDVGPSLEGMLGSFGSAATSWLTGQMGGSDFSEEDVYEAFTSGKLDLEKFQELLAKEGK